MRLYNLADRHPGDGGLKNRDVRYKQAIDEMEANCSSRGDLGEIEWWLIKSKSKIIPASGAIAQLGERIVRNDEVVGSIPTSSTKFLRIMRASRWRPISSFGNSDGDFQMLEWVTGGSGPRFALFVHHEDDVREFAYNRSAVGNLERDLEEAPKRGWTVVSMKNDWNQIFAYEDKEALQGERGLSASVRS
jgi:hypothetical protein